MANKVVSSVVAKIHILSDDSDPKHGFRMAIANHYPKTDTNKEIHVVKHVLGIKGTDGKDTFWIYDQNDSIFKVVAGRPEDNAPIDQLLEHIKRPRTLCLCTNGIYYMNWYPPQRGRVPSAQCTICTFEVDDPNKINISGEGLWNWKRQSVCDNDEGKSVIRVLIVALTDMDHTMTIEINGKKWQLSEKTRQLSS